VEPRTHLAIDRDLGGEPLALAEGTARVRLRTTPRMRADERGLVHGAFVFGLADYAAMLAVNHPNVVLGAAEVRFLKPVVAGETLVAEAAIVGVQGRKRHVRVEVSREGGEAVFAGTFTCFAPERHVLEPRTDG